MIPRKPKRAKSEKTRARIFAAALSEFSARGFDGARVKRIAEKSGTNKERIYWFFGSKTRLYEAVLRHVYGLLAEYEKTFLDWGEAQAEGFAEQLLRGYFRFHAEHPDYWRMMTWENLGGARHSKGLSELRETVFAHLRTLFHSARKKGKLARYPSFESFLYVFFAASFFFFSNRLTLSETLKQDLDAPGVADRYLEDLLGILNA
ncbi:MAG: TetR/AcrR family transcriptional regulator [Spirochaetes bacterium]|nr:TetR/AcrR family transcriptional regulator [Spirochaetota bacterium]